ncbi:MAG: SH3 domain-containing protein [Cytophagales bacterium]|nr:SH3 domain-containing protein [Cytophagales bacterium]
MASDLNQADSLFEAKKYTEALEVYENIFQNDQASPSMLLKMAFIQEGLENYVDALYYLNLYYEKSGNKKALVKMQEIAAANELEGYEFTDQDYILNILSKNKLLIQIALLTLALLLMVYIIRKFQKKESARLPLIFQVLIIAVLFVFNNETFATERAIVLNDHTLLRSAPSAAAEPLESIEKGHRVRVLEQSEVWVKIEWNDQSAYLRKGRIRLI